MMMEGSQAINIPSGGVFQAKLGEPQMELNSQGERVEVQAAPIVEQPQSLEIDDVVPLWDTPLASGLDDLLPPTDDTGMEHKIISWGHVLKSTHDLARWSEKTGALRVNTQEALDSISDLAFSLEAVTPAKAKNSSNNKDSNGSNSNGNNKRRVRRSTNGDSNSRQWKQKSEVVSSGPVLKSTHDLATRAEKKSVNDASTFQVLDKDASNQAGGRSEQLKSEIANKGVGVAVQAGGGSSLQSGLDTQAGSHIQQDSEKLKETPEQVMQNLSVHV